MLAWWLAPPDGATMPFRLWHGHEMVFGFSAAIITGIVFTALPSWAGTPEIRGGRLALLVALWLAGRATFWLAPGLPAALAAGVDCALFLVAAVMVTPQLLAARNKLYLLLLPVLLGLFIGNGLYWLGLRAGDEALAARGLHLGVYAVVLLYVLKGGVLTPIFTGNVLREKGRGDQAPFRMGLETAGVLVLLALAGADLAGLPGAWVGVAAACAAGVHGYRMARWQGWKVADVPLVFVMHLGFLWLVAAFALRALAAFVPAVPGSAWLHAFTVGSLGMMMLGLMTRVVLRHTGHSLELPGPIKLAYGLMFAAALLRVTASWAVSPLLLAASALLWAAPFVIYLGLFGAMLWRPSLPRTGSIY
jgi:uncharacterized protein involved in response to NO